MRKEICIILNVNANFETKQSILGRLAAHFHRLRYIDVPTYSYKKYQGLNGTLTNVPGTVSGRLRSIAPHMRSVRMDDIIRQLHLREEFLKAQGKSTFVIVNPKCPTRRDKVTDHLHVRGIQYRTTSDSWRFLPDVISC